MDVIDTQSDATVYACSSNLARLPGLAGLLGVNTVRWLPPLMVPPRGATVIGWGLKPSGLRARSVAQRCQARPLLIEDGFLRSVGLGVDGAPPLSILLDDQGIYYDTTRPSRLTALLNATDTSTDPLADQALLTRARQCMQRIADVGLSKYNQAPDPVGRVGRTDLPERVLVVDQTFGDASVRCGGADAESFRAMFAAAVAENPSAEILVKTHPDVIAGRKRGYLGRVPADARVTLLTANVNPRALLEQVRRVYTVTSQLGMEALFAGKPVTVFGAPFYAGWGLTDDRVETPHAGRKRDVAVLFSAAYILYPRYIDPATGQRCDVETVIEHLALQRHWHERNRGRIFCMRFQPWKRGFVRTFLAGADAPVTFVRSVGQARRKGFSGDCRLIVWGQRERPDAQVLAAENNVRLERMEDGFLRSGGLGSDMIAPLSLVVDRRGMYYDPRQPSDLEHLLATADIDERLRERARVLRQRIVKLGVSKYNFGPQDRLDIAPRDGQRVILVPGQVEDDVSIQLGCPGPRTNQALLEAVRAAWPGAYIVYKPHPEVLSGNRKGSVPLSSGKPLWDALATDVSVDACLAVADEVHTLTSLVGFEALMRELPVMVYGQPFYAGWGLTEDMHPVARRLFCRRLMLDELVAATLILYPRYIDPKTNMFTTAEVVVDRLQEQAEGNVAGRRLSQPWVVRQARKLWRLAVGVGYAR